MRCECLLTYMSFTVTPLPSIYANRPLKAAFFPSFLACSTSGHSLFLASLVSCVKSLNIFSFLFFKQGRCPCIPPFLVPMESWQKLHNDPAAGASISASGDFSVCSVHWEGQLVCNVGETWLNRSIRIFFMFSLARSGIPVTRRFHLLLYLSRLFVTECSVFFLQSLNPLLKDFNLTCYILHLCAQELKKESPWHFR